MPIFCLGFTGEVRDTGGGDGGAEGLFVLVMICLFDD